MLLRARIVQFVSVLVVQAITLYLLASFIVGIDIASFGAAVGLVLAASVAQALFWWVFIQFLGRLPVILYPILTFFLTGLAVAFIGNLVPGVIVEGSGAGLIIVLTLTVVNALLGGLLSLDEDNTFDRNVTLKMVGRYGTPTKTDVPGFAFLEIDGLSEDILRQALAEGRMPTLRRWLDTGSHRLIGWETDFTAQTGAMQTGILMGSNEDIPAYRWWDRQQGRIVMTGNPRDAKALEARLSTGQGLVSDGGTSRGNMFSGDAAESLFTISTLLNRQRGRGPGFYLFLFSPFVVFRILTRFVLEVLKEWFQQTRQKVLRRDKHIISARNPAYAFLRGLLGPLLEEFVTFAVISDIMRGVPAIYGLYAGYDDVAHFAGMATNDALEMLTGADRYIARIERALAYAPRPYHLIVLTDHGQSSGAVFKTAHGVTLEGLVKQLIKGQEGVYATEDTNEAYDLVNAFLTESVNSDTRTAELMRRVLEDRMQDGVVAVGPERSAEEVEEDQALTRAANVIVVGSGCTGLINFKYAQERMSFERIQERYPDLILGLSQHGGIGWVMVKSEAQGTMIIGKKGIHYLDEGTVEGAEDPLAVYGPYAVEQMRRASSFTNCADIVVNTIYDPVTQELCGFENQASHHGGLGGPQSHAFVLFPSSLPYDEQPLFGAEAVYRLLRGWRAEAQGLDKEVESYPPSR